MPIPSQHHNTVVVGVKKEGASPDFIKKVRAFCKQPDAELCLVHAVEEKMKFPSLYREIFGSFDITELGRELPETHEREARAKLEALRAALDDQQHLRVRILHSDDAAACLIAEAQITRACVIAIEIEKHLYQLVPRGLSVALSLMQNSPVPVLLLRHGSENTFAKAEHTIVIADDLSAASLAALRRGMNVAAHWGNTQVLHLHVIEQNLHAVLAELAEISKKVEVGPLGTPELLDYLEQHMELALQRRAEEFKEALKKSGGSYAALVQVGNVAHRVSALLREKKPDLAVFGRRHRMHPGPFGFGRVPFAAMLSDTNAVLIAP